MQRAIRSLLCALLLATPALALGSPGTCSKGSGPGMKTASCCGPVCHCNASRGSVPIARSWCMQACAGSHGDAHSAPAAGTLVRTTVESLPDPLALAHVHPAAVQSAELDTPARCVRAQSPSAIPRLHGHPQALLCTLQI